MFPKGTYPKVNVIAWLVFELAYYNFAVHRFNRYTMRPPTKHLESSLDIKTWSPSKKTKHLKSSLDIKTWLPNKNLNIWKAV